MCVCVYLPEKYNSHHSTGQILPYMSWGEPLPLPLLCRDANTICGEHIQPMLDLLKEIYTQCFDILNSEATTLGLIDFPKMNRDVSFP